MNRKQKSILLIISTIICGTIVFLQYQSQKNKHKRLLTNGQKTKVIAKPYRSWGVDYASYYFITTEGLRIEGKRKCGNEFYKYLNTTVIYNPTKPNEYDLYFDFESYFPTEKIIFFFFIYLPVMTFLTYRFTSVGVTIYLKLKS